MAEYTATEAAGPRLPVINRRVSPTESGEYAIRTDIIPIVEDAERLNVGVARLYEAPVTAYGGAGMVVTDYATGVPLTGALTWPPADGTFFVAPYLARLYFHANKIGGRVSARYAGSGSLVDAVDVNHVNDKATSAAKPFETVTVPANGQVILQQRIALTVLGDNGSGVYVPNPTWAAIEVYDPNDVETYRSIIKNTSPTPQTVLVKTFKHHRKDQ